MQPQPSPPGPPSLLIIPSLRAYDAGRSMIFPDPSFRSQRQLYLSLLRRGRPKLLLSAQAAQQRLIDVGLLPLSLDLRERKYEEQLNGDNVAVRAESFRHGARENLYFNCFLPGHQVSRSLTLSQSFSCPGGFLTAFLIRTNILFIPNPTFFPILKMRLPTLSTIILTLAAQALASLHADFANGGLQDQLPMFKDDEPITRTSTTTRTHYEINVISTVYRTRAHAAHSEPTPNVHPETSESTLVFGVEGTGCDKKACTICRMLNNCSDDEVNW